MKISTQLITLSIASYVQAQDSDIINFVNSQISIVDAGLPTDQVQSVISFVDGQISQAWATGNPTVVTGIGNNDGNASAGGSNTQATPTDNSDNSSATPTNGSPNSGSSGSTSNSASASSTASSSSSNSKLGSSVKYINLVSVIAFTLIGNYLL
jgi:hypothetical protein